MFTSFDKRIKQTLHEINQPGTLVAIQTIETLNN
jgi:hypothetical protein